MPVEATKIKERLKAKFPGVNLAKQRQDAIAEKLAPKLEKDDDIDPKLDELNEILPFADIAKQDDRLRTLEAKDKGQQKPDASNSDAGTDDDDDDTSDKNQNKNNGTAKVPKYVKDLLAKVDNLTTQVTTLSTQKQQETIKQKLSNNEKLKGIKPSFYNKRQLPSKDEEIDAFVDEIVADHTAFLQESGYDGITPHTPPVSTAPANGKVKIDPDLVKHAKKQNEQALAENKTA